MIASVKASTVAYCASKWGVRGLTKAAAIEYGRDRIRVNAVSPGYFRTQLTEGVFQDPERSAWIHSRIPMGRVGSPADLGGAVVFLASDQSSYMTGQAINVTGGQEMR